MATSRRKLLRMAGACAALGSTGLLGSSTSAAQQPSGAASSPQQINRHPTAAECHLGHQPPNPIEEFVCCDARSFYDNTSGLPNPVGPFEIITSGFIWTEGPVWVGDEAGYLLFSDVPGDVVYKWDGKSTTPFLKPSGSRITPTPHYIREGGINGMALGRGGLIACDTGNRCMVRIDLNTRERTVLADNYNGKRFNSPNDVAVAKNGNVYFTDPPTGLNANYRDKLMELGFTGVFMIDMNNKVHLVADNLRPNGTVLSPDDRTLFVTNRTGWVAIDLDENGLPLKQRLFVARSVTGGGADGAAMDAAGKLWSSGPGGVHLFSAKGEHIAYAPIQNRIANMIFDPAGYIYVTNCNRMIRAKIKPEFAA